MEYLFDDVVYDEELPAHQEEEEFRVSMGNEDLVDRTCELLVLVLKVLAFCKYAID